MMSLRCLFVLSLFPRDVLDEIWDFIKLVSEGVPTYFFIAPEILPAANTSYCIHSAHLRKRGFTAYIGYT